IGLRGDLPNCILVPKSLEKANLTQGTARISVGEDADPIFIMFALYATPVVKRINAVSKGSTFKEISLNDLRKIEIAKPKEIEEQRAIAAVLSTWDRAIDLTRRLIETKKARQKGLMQQ